MTWLSWKVSKDHESKEARVQQQKGSPHTAMSQENNKRIKG
jgi:hypothetical protein